VDIATVDYWANAGGSYLHRASPTAKLMAAALGLAAVIVVFNLFLVATVFVLVVALAWRAGIPVRKLILISLYPGVFALLFAMAQFHGDFIIPGTTIAKAVGAASVVVLLIATTPYPRLFAALRPVLPGFIVEVLYVTYRSVFILLGVLSDVLIAVRLRGGFTGRALGRRLQGAAVALAVATLRSFEISERTYAVMQMRGYSGRISGEASGGLHLRDVPLVGAAAAVAGQAFLFRYEWRALNPFSWAPFAAALLVLAVAMLVPRAAVAGGRERPVSEMLRGDAQ